MDSNKCNMHQKKSQGDGLVINEVRWEPSDLKFKSQQRKEKTPGNFFSFVLALVDRDTWYLPVGGGRYPVELVEMCKQTRTPQLSPNIHKILEI